MSADAPMDSATPTPVGSPSSASSSSEDADMKAVTITTASGAKGRKCRFNDCDNLAVDGTSKCAFHKNRRQCCVENCTNQVYARKLCVRHGGKKQCQADSCEAHARGGGFCLQHGGFVVKRFCIVEGCSKQAHARQKCVRHGGGRRCKVDGCMQHARAGGLCNRHSHGHECRIDGCTKTAQHSGSICFRHAMELRAHGQEVPELNISKGGRLSSKKRQQLQREQQLKQEQFHAQQIHQQQQQMHHQQQQQQQQPMAMAAATAPVSAAPPVSSASANPFGLPLKINVPTSMPKFSLRTPLGTNSFPTPRSHDFSVLMGLPSPQIDNSQLPSVLAMSNAANAQRSAGLAPPTSSGYEPMTPLTASFLANGPPSISRGGARSFLSLGLFPTPTTERVAGAAGHDEDLDAIISNYSKFMATPTPDAASPLAYHHAAGGGQYAPPMLEHIGAGVFDHNAPPTPGALRATPLSAAAAANGVAPAHLQRLKMDFLSPHPAHAHGQEGGFPTAGPGAAAGDGSADYTAQFFADAKSDKRQAKSAAVPPAPKAAGVTAA